MTVIAVAMSGGADSMAAALLLSREGHQVMGLHFLTTPGAPVPPELLQAARALSIPLEVADLSQGFDRHVIHSFAWAWRRGMTPNPCMACNRHVKFGLLAETARRLGCSALATGHYARLSDAPNGPRLFKGEDETRDQSYFLARVRRQDLGFVRFPLARLRKTRVKEILEKEGLLGLTKPESRETCFAPEGDYPAFLERLWGGPLPPGDIVDPTGRVLGRHAGIHRYTPGQRRGLGCPDAEPWYVTAVDAENNRILVGRDQDLFRREVRVRDVSWLCAPPKGPLEVAARLRYRQQEAPALLTPLDPEDVVLEFAEPQRAPAPGQGAVFFLGDRVLGGGYIRGEP
ncbi:MAG: tRNA 2-thiouridine(34) synthase MnmA [Proteobacteria bacterium]|nr:tRNA 2-thiouridine(34) synthase MnmA [Pseudomonadota bacterium]